MEKIEDWDAGLGEAFWFQKTPGDPSLDPK